MDFELPSLRQQREIVYRANVDKACGQLKDNLNAPHFRQFDPRYEDPSLYSQAHLRKENEGWEPPAPDLVYAYFSHFKSVQSYASDKELAHLLGITDRQIRRFKSGETPVPYGIWHKFLVITGRKVQDIYPVIGFFELPPTEESDHV
ncbi:hypothetical protein [Serratia ficaria]|uniref:hypothetical protein n=1 Tax=Serratia ficaria TaxID=61651 RepID=UPI0021C66128|nr:hypothetical protein [Serratia ficaria]